MKNKCKMYNVKCKMKNGSPFLHSTFYILHSKAGQAAVFMLMALVVLAFMVLWKLDLHTILFNKDRAQTAGDAAALAAARWQASSLNLIGEINLLHALAISADPEDTTACQALEDMQVRMCFAGPMAGFLAMQQAAKQNRIHTNEEFTDYLREHAQKIRFEYPEEFPEPWPDAWNDYADMLEAIVKDKIAAGPENLRLYDDFREPHILADKAFYRAVNSRNWCWFYLHYDNPLEWYDGNNWPDLPLNTSPPDDCEFLGLHLARHSTDILTTMLTIAQLRQHAEELDYDPATFSPVVPPQIPPIPTRHTWMTFNGGEWGRWFAISQDNDNFPVRGEVKPEFDYAGADAVARVHATSSRITPNRNHARQVDEIVWTAAAKPFGFIEVPNSATRLPPTMGGDYVLPVFDAVRLIPVGTASAGNTGGFDLYFRRHVRDHLPVYLSSGHYEPGCPYCNTLKIFDDPDYRKAGNDWLDHNAGLCTLPPPGGGGGRGGGTPIGH